MKPHCFIHSDKTQPQLSLHDMEALINGTKLVSLCKSTITGSSCSKLTSLVKVSLKFQMLISEMCQYFLLKKCVKLAVQKLLSFFQQNISVYLVIKT